MITCSENSAQVHEQDQPKRILKYTVSECRKDQTDYFWKGLNDQANWESDREDESPIWAKECISRVIAPESAKFPHRMTSLFFPLFADFFFRFHKIVGKLM